MIGIRLNNYEIVSLLGEGGMGMVYLARHPYMGRRAAVKVLRPELLHDKLLVARFMEEARATNAIQHPNIIDIIDVGILPETQTPYLMMEFLDGESLASRLQASRPLSVRETVDIACQTASALSAAHACQIIHRDLKPDNLFLIPDESLPLKTRVKVLDFGIAKLRGDMRARSAQTKSGVLMGTPFYMSPEQCRGFAVGVDHRSDIYSLGVIVYEMLCGHVPFVSDGVGDLLVRHITEPPAPLRSHVPTIPEAIERVVLRALAKNPGERYESMTAFSRALSDGEASIETQSSAGPDASNLALALARTDAGASPMSVQFAGVEQIASEKAKSAAGLPSWVSTPNARSMQTTLSSMAGQVHSSGVSRYLDKRRLVLAATLVGVLALGAAVAILLVRPKSLPATRPVAPTSPTAVLSPPMPTAAPAPPLSGSPKLEPSSPPSEMHSAEIPTHQPPPTVFPQRTERKETRRKSKGVSLGPRPAPEGSRASEPVATAPTGPSTGPNQADAKAIPAISKPAPSPTTNTTGKWGGRL